MLFLSGSTFITVYWNTVFKLQNASLYNTTDTIFAIISAITLGFIWLPQIYTTFNTKGPGSLSVVMLCFTCPGAYAMTYFLAFGYKNPLYVWLPNAMGSVCQTVLLTMCIYYSRKSKSKGEDSTSASINRENVSLFNNEEDFDDTSYVGVSSNRTLIQKVDREKITNSTSTTPH